MLERVLASPRHLSLVERLDHRFYPDVESHWDDRLLRARILQSLRANHQILDLGAGAGIVEAMNFRPLCAHVVGIDPDASVFRNPHLDDAHLGVAEQLPFEDGSFDLVVCDNVLEHLSAPGLAFAEVARVLRSGGLFFGKTPSLTHYVPTFARMTPTRFHRWFNARRGRRETDTFPTRYRANTAARIRELASGPGLAVRSIEFFEDRPEYLRVSALTYPFGIAYERLVNRFKALARFRAVIVAILEKP